MRNRAGSGSRARVVSVPHSTSRGWWDDPVSITPYPRTAVPGSMPSTFTALASGLCLRQLGCVDVEVGGHFGDIVQLFQHIHETNDALRIGSFDSDGVLGNHGELGRVDGQSTAPERVLYRVEGGRRRGDDVLVTFARKILGSAVQRRFQCGIFIVPGCIEQNLPL